MPLIEIPADLEKDRLEKILYKIPFISPSIREARHAEGIIRVVTDETSHSAMDIEKKVRLLIEEVKNTKKFTSKIKRHNRKEGRKYHFNVFNELVETKQVIPYGNGLNCYGGDFFKLVRCIDRKLELYCESQKAQNWEFPELLTMRDIHRIQYLNHYPHQALAVSHVLENIESIEALSKRADGDSRIPASFLSEPDYLLRHALCIHFYKIHENESISPAPCRIATTIGKCNRYESKNMRTFERLCQFTMREIVYIGSTQTVNGERGRLMDFFCEMTERLDLEFELVTSNDPFFTVELDRKALFQHVAETKYEMALPLDETRKLAVASFNYHGTSFSDAFQICSALPDTRIHTACFGYGLERMAYAFLIQHGANPRAWPPSVKDYLQW